MIKGLFIDTVLIAVHGGLPNTEISVEYVDIEALLPMAVSFAESELDKADVRSYRFDRVGFFTKRKPPLIEQELEVVCVSSQVYKISIPLRRESLIELRVLNGEQIVPIYENRFESISASRVPVLGYKKYKTNIVDIMLKGIGSGTTLSVEYQMDFEFMQAEDEMPFTNEVLDLAIKSMVQYFLQERQIPTDDLNNNIDDIKKSR